MPGWPFFFFNFKGTPSREEHKTVPSVFTTVGSASTGQDLFLRSSVSPYSCCMVPRCPRTATVQRATLLYIFLCWPAPIDGDDLSVQCTGTGPYSSCTVPTWHRTVAVRCRRGTVQRYLRYMMTKLAPVSDFIIVCMRTGWFNCCEDAGDCFMLLSWRCPFKIKKGKWPTRHFKIIYRLIPLSIPVTCRWTVR